MLLGQQQSGHDTEARYGPRKFMDASHLEAPFSTLGLRPCCVSMECTLRMSAGG